MTKPMTTKQLQRAIDQGRAKLSEAERQSRDLQRRQWRAAAPVVREWYEVEKIKGCMSLNARQNVEKLISDLEAGSR